MAVEGERVGAEQLLEPRREPVEDLLRLLAGAELALEPADAALERVALAEEQALEPRAERAMGRDHGDAEGHGEDRLARARVEGGGLGERGRGARRRAEQQTRARCQSSAL